VEESQQERINELRYITHRLDPSAKEVFWEVMHFLTFPTQSLSYLRGNAALEWEWGMGPLAPFWNLYSRDSN